MTSNSQRMLGEPEPRPAGMTGAETKHPSHAAENAQELERLLKQFVARLNEGEPKPSVRDLQKRISSLAQSNTLTSRARHLHGEQSLSAPRSSAGASTAVEDRLAEFTSYFEHPERPHPSPATPKRTTPDRETPVRQSAMLLADVTAETSHWEKSNPSSTAAEPKVNRALPDQFPKEPEQSRKNSASPPISEAASAIDRRLDDIIARLEAIQRSTSREDTLQNVSAQLADLSRHMGQAAARQELHGQNLAKIGQQLNRIESSGQQTKAAIDKAVERTAAAIQHTAEWSEKAAAIAAEQASRRTMELTVRHMSEALKQMSPAARFAAIETEVRALNHHSRETGQRAARALEDVQATLRQFLERVSTQRHPDIPPVPPAAKKADLTTPVRTPSPQPARHGQTDRSCLDPVAANPLQPNAQNWSWPEKDNKWSVAAVADHHKAKAADANAPVVASPQTLLSEGPKPDSSDAYEAENGRTLKAGLAVAAIILLIASAGLLYLSVTGKKPLAPPLGPAAKSAMLAQPETEKAPVTASIGTAAVIPAASRAYAEAARPKKAIEASWAAYIEPVSAVATPAQEENTTAFSKLKRLAEEGDAQAQFRLAAAYERGVGVEKNLGAAQTWYRRAAETGNVTAMHNLGHLYIIAGKDRGSKALALQWFYKAAAYGMTDSQFNLGVLLESGFCGRVDAVEAYKWYALAAANGDSEAERRRLRLLNRLSNADIRRAEALIAAWKPLQIDEATKPLNSDISIRATSHVSA